MTAYEVWQQIIISPWCPTVMMMLPSYLTARSYHDDVQEHMMISSPYCCKEWGSDLGSALILQPPSPKPPPRGHTQKLSKIIRQITRIHKENHFMDTLFQIIWNYSYTIITAPPLKPPWRAHLHKLDRPLEDSLYTIFLLLIKCMVQRYDQLQLQLKWPCRIRDFLFS